MVAAVKKNRKKKQTRQQPQEKGMLDINLLHHDKFLFKKKKNGDATKGS